MEDTDTKGAAGDPVEDIEATARKAMTAKEWAAAATLWDKLSQQLDGDAAAYALSSAGKAHRKRGATEDAKSCLAKALRINPDDRLARVELSRLEDHLSVADEESKYWERRRDNIYLSVVRAIATRIASNATSILDVGSNATPVLSWFPNVPTRVSVDLRHPYAADGIRSVKADFLNWEPGRTFDVGLCLQVVEHVEDPFAFCQKLLLSAEVNIVSLPFKWHESQCRHHLHDPVGRNKIETWFGRRPNYSYIATELDGVRRIICVFDRKSTSRWRSVQKTPFKYRWSLAGTEALLAP